MTDLSIYELEDIIWDDFECSGDHIVPHPTEDHVSEDKCEGDSCKKPRLEVTPLQSNEGHAYGSICQFKEERESKTLNKETDVMEKDSWSHIPDGVLNASDDVDSAKDVLSVESGDTKLSKYSFKSSNINSGSELCTDKGMLKDTSDAVDRNSYNDLNLFPHDGDDKESSDLLYFSWPDIENFEEVDRILCNCDSSLGLGITGNEDELAWLTSEDPGGGYEEALKMDLNFPCSEPSALTNVSQDYEPRKSNNKASRFVSESKVELNLKDQKEQSRKQNQTEGSSISSELDDISPEATALRQLQQVMLQLDVRTKLCIRDSMYRLARSAEQRHNYAGVSDSTANHGGTGGPIMAEGTSKYTGLMDMETDTNPIDRTIAHLLFHRPSDSSNMPTPSPLKLNTKVHGSMTGPPMVADKPPCQQTEDESDDKISSTRKN